MSSKIYIGKIIRDHWGSLQVNGRTSFVDVLVFYGLPLACGVVFYSLKQEYKPELLVQIDNVVVAAFSIFGALLFSVQVLIIGLMDRHRNKHEQKGREGSLNRSAEDRVFETKSVQLKDRALRELFCNVSYCIFLAIVMVSFALALIFTEFHGSVAMKSVQLAIGLHFLLTSLMILKRMHVVFDGRMGGP